MALSSLSVKVVLVSLVEVMSPPRLLSPPGLSLLDQVLSPRSRRVLVGVVVAEPSWLDGLEGGLLVGVEVLAGERVLSSELQETSESSAKIPNLLLVFHVLHALCPGLDLLSLCLPPVAPSVSMTWLGPKKTNWEL